MHGSLKTNLKLSLPVLVILVALSGGTGLLSEHFLTQANLANVAHQASSLIVVTLGESLTLFTGGIDLSIGGVMSLATTIVSTSSNSLGWGAMALALLVGLAIGLINALGVIWLKIHPLMMTLAMMSLAKGTTLILLPVPGGNVNYGFFQTFYGGSTFGLATSLALLLYLAAFIALSWTRTGRSIYAIGSDATAAYTTGLRVRSGLFIAYGACGTLAALAGCLLSVRTLSGDPLIGEAYTLDAISAAILGGIALQGGRGNVIGALLGALTMALVNNVFNLVGFFTFYQYVFKGVILVLALLFFARKRFVAAL